MRKFLRKLLLFSSCVAMFLIALTFWRTPREKSSPNTRDLRPKDSLLMNTPSPRIIFIGGSNLLMGLNSQLIKDSLGYNIVNLGISADLGLEYMFRSSIHGIRSKDIVIAIPEYEHLFGRAYGGLTLFEAVLYEGKDAIKQLSLRQLKGMICNFPQRTFSKLSVNELYPWNPMYDCYADLNQYGDAQSRSSNHNEIIATNVLIKNQFDNKMFQELMGYKKNIEGKGAKFYIGFPGLQEESFRTSKNAIEEGYKIFQQNNIDILGTPERYIMPDSLLYDSPYHLSLRGRDVRTELLISDMKKFISRINLQ